MHFYFLFYFFLLICIFSLQLQNDKITKVSKKECDKFSQIHAILPIADILCQIIYVTVVYLQYFKCANSFALCICSPRKRQMNSSVARGLNKLDLFWNLHRNIWKSLKVGKRIKLPYRAEIYGFIFHYHLVIGIHKVWWCS